MENVSFVLKNCQSALECKVSDIQGRRACCCFKYDDNACKYKTLKSYQNFRSFPEEVYVLPYYSASTNDFYH